MCPLSRLLAIALSFFDREAVTNHHLRFWGRDYTRCVLNIRVGQPEGTAETKTQTADTEVSG